MKVLSSAFIHCDYCGRHTRAANCRKDVCVRLIILAKNDDKNLVTSSPQYAVTILSMSSDQEVAEMLLGLNDVIITYDLSSMIISSIF